MNQSPPHDHIVYNFIPLAENTARKWYRIVRGEERGIDLDDALSEARALLPSIARTYRPERGSVVAVVKPAVFRHLQRKFAPTLRGDTELLRYGGSGEDSEALSPDKEPSVSPTQEQELMLTRIREWASTPERRALVESMEGPATSGPRDRHARCPRISGARHAELLADLRAHLGAAAQANRGRLWSAGRTARYLRLPERQVRGLCEDGQLPAIRENGWCVRRKDADSYRRRKVKDALENGATLREAARAGNASVSTAQRVHAKHFEPRRRGRRPTVHDPIELLAVLTDATRAPHTWIGGEPCVSAVARFLGCPRMTVQRELRRQLQQLFHCRGST
ncbi:MAG TPA: hypothetical protein PKC59_03815 [Burkholderiaceae bacterium]|uniref:hypothetical protein n=1 Tax=Accumulibacter sp. TaxID=2053492 RepID=UPI002D04BB2A|nr:hypothetical protein [Accumulibacter sp.]HMW22540.1 hypothetical protein [Burkholderiaceae bacterium]HMW80299.1 hypothetical protein [Accumulibacter sp.]HMY98027.1 hypothetical protein [Burkholderiaceae bacterium]HNG77984.1 hypothetical protein [Burkholderiaceae bacterium]